ncbi:MAG: cell wall metabolism sensor histidine kinase WalK [Clostridiaceae bacterium]|jgi:two-component system sensor histidine kinase VicK|nr:cell wall metabolism sensor histidine kinase WalK [Clostridiaceae bacterium]
MFLRSLQWRLIIIIVAITFVLMSVIWVFLFYKVEDIFYNDFKDTVTDNYAVLNINENMSVQNLIKKLEDDPYTLSQLAGREKSFTILDGHTHEIVYSLDVSYKKNKIDFRNEILKSENLMAVINDKNEGKEKKLTRSAKGDDFYDYVKRQALSDGDYILYFKYNRSQALQIIGEFSNVIFTGMLIAVAVAIVIGFLLSRTITKPIIDIMHKAENITSGDFEQVLEVKSEDEIGKLTRTFNYMTSQLKSMLNEISSEKNKFELILNFMTDGIIAFNREGLIIHINSAAVRFLELQHKDLTFEGIMDKLGLTYALPDMLDEENLADIKDNITIRDRFYRVNFASFTDKENTVEGIITVIQDITESQKLDNMRKEFVANVSHELKTPLTSIKSYSETLLDGAVDDPETAKSFLQVIYLESNRMDRIVKDLLLLSKHDSGIQLNLQRISPTELTQSVIQNLKMTADEKHQKIKMVETQKAPDISGDWDRLEQLLFNIVGNAIKYTPDYGEIVVYVGRREKNACISVVDNGIGIPEQDLGRIFERFYRVDKARSRQMGGTGLGLSIAREIAEFHGGHIEAKSEPNKGTEITIILPGIVVEQ